MLYLLLPPLLSEGLSYRDLNLDRYGLFLKLFFIRINTINERGYLKTGSSAMPNIPTTPKGQGVLLLMK